MKKKEKTEQPICIGLIDEDPDDVLLIQRTFEKNNIKTEIIHYKNVNDASAHISESDRYDGIILKNQSFPEKSALLLSFQFPILLLIHPENEKLAAEAINAGVDNYLIMDSEGFYLKMLPLIFMRMLRRKRELTQLSDLIRQDSELIQVSEMNQRQLTQDQVEKALRESEEKYRSMMAAIPDPMYICSSDFRITYMNPAMIRRTGRKAIGEPCHQVVHHLDKRCPWCFYEKIFSGTPYEIEVNNPDDGRSYHVSNAPVFHSDGTISKMTILRDITEKKAQESVIKKAKDTAQAANRVKSEFLANMSHEIRTPMNSIIGMIDLTLNTSPDAKQKDFLTTAKISADSLLELLNDILELSEMDINQNLKLDEKDIEVRHFLESFVQCSYQRARQKNLKMTLNLSPDVPAFVRTDARRVRQILNNLIRNAIKFTEKGKIEILCKIRNRESLATDLKNSEFHLLFAVSDTGIGIAPDRMDNIFERFTQADSSHTRQFGGTGVGITLSKYLAEMMGGEIWVESELGKGSTFYFTIKTRLGKAVPPSEPVLQKPSDKPEKQIRILLAEDNPLNQKLVLAILHMRGHLTEVVSNGRAVLELLEKEKFDLILMDIQMPEMDGLEATRHIREKEKETGAHIPIVAITAHAMQRDKEQCLSAGMDAYLSKPIRHDQFLATIESLVPTETNHRPDSTAPCRVDKAERVHLSTPVKEIDKEVFDKDGLSEIVGGSVELVTELIHIYLNNLPKLLSNIQEAIEERDSKKLEFNAHSLKGMSLNLSAKKVANISSELEKFGRNEELSQAAEFFTKLEKEAEKLTSVLDESE